MEQQIETIDNNNENSNSDSSHTTEDKTYHFRKGSDLDGFESFGTLFADGLFTDLAICCSGRVFRCHRVIMAASSLYMKNALSAFNNSNHNNCNTVMIMPQDIKVADMEAILHFIYNGQVEVTRDAIESFLTSAKTLNIKGLANIKLVYNNSNHNNSNNNNNHNNNQNNENHNHNNQNNHMINNNKHNSSNSNDNNTNSNTSNDNNMKRRNGMIATNRSQLKNDLNFSSFSAIPQTQSFHTSPQIDLNTSPSHRRKQKFPSIPATNGFAKDKDRDKDSSNDESQWITITDEEEGEELEIDEKTVEKLEENERTSGEEISQESVPQMPCLIQIDADPTTFPSYCPESTNTTTDNSIKRRRSSSLRSLPEIKIQKSGNNSVKMNRNNDQIRKPMKIVRSSNRKLGFIFHKSSTSIWNSNKWKCEICNKLYGNKQTLKEHIDYFHSNRAEQIFRCDICAKEYTWKKSLMKHYRDIHQINNHSLAEITKQSDSMVTSVNSSQNK